jgi:hypothetical protein
MNYAKPPSYKAVKEGRFSYVRSSNYDYFIHLYLL